MQDKSSTGTPQSASRDIPQHLLQFVATYRLRLRRDSCNDHVILGRSGEVFAYDEVLLGLTVFASSTRAWTHLKKKLISNGFRLTQDCDQEGVLAFDPLKTDLVPLALQAAGIKKRRVIGLATKERLAGFSRARRGTAAEALQAAEAIAEGGAYITAHPDQVSPERGSPAMKLAKMDGAK